MKVILVNGSPHSKGCTFTGLEEVQKELENSGIETEIFQIGVKPISGCIACQKCRGVGRCIIDDVVNDFIEKAEQADGFIFGSPVHYAGASGALTSFMDRAFYAGGRSDKLPFYLKPAAAIVSARRAGTTATFDQLIKYFTISEMPIVSSRYWNMIHGNTPEEVKQDLEGLQTLCILGKNMAWLLKCKEAAIQKGIPLPEKEDKVITNFIR